MSRYELHVISNGKLAWKDLAAVAARIHPYVTAIHIREKTKPMDEIFIGIQDLLEKGVPARSLYINGFPWMADAAGLGGLHLPESSPQLLMIRESSQSVQRTGVSVHSMEEAVKRESEGADYVLYGHIFATKSKLGVPPRGLEQLRKVAGQVAIPVIAIGGITPEKVRPVLEAGAAGIAVMSGIWEAADPVETVKAYIRELQSVQPEEIRGERYEAYE
ncbi:thiamine phosphate synthase [Paenibacillus planticolens]|uniref:Thiazole tautomerase TenI n=1 Tax=Paenibacillus planticolens TaxID=2654976 RepID=A0ABX1ZNA5_9BACL|nr:thiamine phosphate synthase [Paenibacillus planticolens]NOV01547.1 thiazole tautomerase TenI [Paenibacillus planticolens]